MNDMLIVNIEIVPRQNIFLRVGYYSVQKKVNVYIAVIKLQNQTARE